MWYVPQPGCATVAPLPAVLGYVPHSAHLPILGHMPYAALIPGARGSMDLLASSSPWTGPALLIQPTGTDDFDTPALDKVYHMYCHNTLNAQLLVPGYEPTIKDVLLFKDRWDLERFFCDFSPSFVASLKSKVMLFGFLSPGLSYL